MDNTSDIWVNTAGATVDKNSSGAVEESFWSTSVVASGDVVVDVVSSVEGVELGDVTLDLGRTSGRILTSLLPAFFSMRIEGLLLILWRTDGRSLAEDLPVSGVALSRGALPGVAVSVFPASLMAIKSAPTLSDEL